jgi:hypothetical protein
MLSCGTLRRVALVRTDVLEEISASIVKETRIGELHRLLVTTKFLSTPILVTLMMEALSCSEMSALTRARRRNIPDEGIRHCRRRENLKSYLR